MFRRIFPLVGGLLCAFALAAPAFARPHVIAQRSSPKGIGSVYMRRGVAPGHRYQIRITAHGHVKFSGSGTEFFTFVANGRFQSGNKNMILTGTTPKSFTIDQPAKGAFQEWLLAVQVENAARTSMTVKFVDMGKHA